MRVAVAQFSAGMNKPADLERIAGLSARAADAGARLVVQKSFVCHDRD
jgi:predicted amidohydrolase